MFQREKTNPTSAYMLFVMPKLIGIGSLGDSNAIICSLSACGVASADLLRKTQLCFLQRSFLPVGGMRDAAHVTTILDVTRVRRWVRNFHYFSKQSRPRYEEPSLFYCIFSFWLPRVTQKKTVITKNWITSKFYLDWHQTSATLGQACVADISKVSILYFKNSLFHWDSKNVLQMSSPALQAIWIRRAKFSMTLPHSSLGIALIVAVIAAFRSGIVWGFLPYTLSLRYPHR